MNDTIFAPATPAGRGAVAILRISGRDAGPGLLAITGRPLPKARRASVRRLRGGAGELLDEAVVLWMPGPGSFTGEDCAELHLHGGAAVVASVAERLGELGLRLAQAGEFTRRAFEHGRLDLSQAEAIADLVDAETAAQRRQALAQYGGALSLRYEAWRDALLDVLALFEAGIDFPDEEVPSTVLRQAEERLSAVSMEIETAVADTRGERVRDGYRVALVGPPNVGKSSLLNALAGRDAAIVTEVAGTTRDIIEVALVLEGHLVIVADTAGLRDTRDVIEAEGVRRAKAWAAAADLRIGVADRTRVDTFAQAVLPLRLGDILAINKSDLEDYPVIPGSSPGVSAIETSATEEGIAGLREAMAARVAARAGEGFPAVTRARHRELLGSAGAHLRRALAGAGAGVELASEDVRLALRSLEQVLGRANPEAVLDRVFSTFCIGK